MLYNSNNYCTINNPLNKNHYNIIACTPYTYFIPLPPLKKNKGKKKENKKYQPANRMHTCHRRERAAIVPGLGERMGGRTERRTSRSKE